MFDERNASQCNGKYELYMLHPRTLPKYRSGPWFFRATSTHVIIMCITRPSARPHSHATPHRVVLSISIPVIILGVGVSSEILDREIHCGNSESTCCVANLLDPGRLTEDRKDGGPGQPAASKVQGKESAHWRQEPESFCLFWAWTIAEAGGAIARRMAESNVAVGRDADVYR